jgi:hypothetical protein
VFSFEALKMRVIFKFVCAGLVYSSSAVWAQPSQPFPIGSPQSCVNLPNHAAIQECQEQQKAQGREWQQQIKDRYAPMPPRLNGVEIKSPMNCFKRESTGEQVCAN